jgi:hypothetical protein
MLALQLQAQTAEPSWHWSTGVQIGWVLVNTVFGAAVTIVWAVLVVVRLRLREVLGMRRALH